MRIQMTKKVFNGIDYILRLIISVLLLLMTAVIFYQVILRYIFQGSNVWAEEFARYAFIWVVMLGSACAVRRYKHIRIDFLVDRMSPKLRYVVELVTYLIMIAMLLLLTYYGFAIANQTMGQLSSGMHISKGFMYTSIPVGSLFMIIFIIEILVNDFILKKGSTGKV